MTSKRKFVAADSPVATDDTKKRNSSRTTPAKQAQTPEIQAELDDLASRIDTIVNDIAAQEQEPESETIDPEQYDIADEIENKPLKQNSNSTVIVQDKDSLNGFGSSSITDTQDDEEKEEDYNEYYRNQLIEEANKSYTPRITAVQGNGNGNGISKANKIDESPIVKLDREEEESLAAENKLSADDINFTLNTIIKEAPHDKLSIIQLFYGMASAFTKRPIHHIVNSKKQVLVKITYWNWYLDTFLIST